MNPIQIVIKQLAQIHLKSGELKEILVIDVGCGNGDEVYRLNKNGFIAFGCDLNFKKGERTNELKKKGILKRIEKNYRLPFADNSAHIVFSNQVIEHVKNIEEFFSEISRILKPEGISVHCYPNINRFIEPHIKIPLATRIQSYLWIKLWNSLNLFNMPENEWKKKGVQSMADYLKEKTWYRSNRDLKTIAKKYFPRVWFDGDLLLHSISKKRKAALFRSLPFGAKLFNSTWTSLLITKKGETVE